MTRSMIPPSRTSSALLLLLLVNCFRIQQESLVVVDAAACAGGEATPAQGATVAYDGCEIDNVNIEQDDVTVTITGAFSFASDKSILLKKTPVSGLTIRLTDATWAQTASIFGVDLTLNLGDVTCNGCKLELINTQLTGTAGALSGVSQIIWGGTSSIKIQGSTVNQDSGSLLRIPRITDSTVDIISSTIDCKATVANEQCNAVTVGDDNNDVTNFKLTVDSSTIKAGKGNGIGTGKRFRSTSTLEVKGTSSVITATQNGIFVQGEKEAGENFLEGKVILTGATITTTAVDDESTYGVRIGHMQSGSQVTMSGLTVQTTGTAASETSVFGIYFEQIVAQTSTVSLDTLNVTTVGTGDATGIRVDMEGSYESAGNFTATNLEVITTKTGSDGGDAKGLFFSGKRIASGVNGVLSITDSKSTASCTTSQNSFCPQPLKIVDSYGDVGQVTLSNSEFIGGNPLLDSPFTFSQSVTGLKGEVTVNCVTWLDTDASNIANFLKAESADLTKTVTACTDVTSAGTTTTTTAGATTTTAAEEASSMTPDSSSEANQVVTTTTAAGTTTTGTTTTVVDASSPVADSVSSASGSTTSSVVIIDDNSSGSGSVGISTLLSALVAITASAAVLLM